MCGGAPHPPGGTAANTDRFLAQAHRKPIALSNLGKGVKVGGQAGVSMDGEECAEGRGAAHSQVGQ